jgi:hypothetical protein
MTLKSLIEEGLDHMDSFYGKESTVDLRKTLAITNDPYKLFRMLQIFREALGVEDTGFKVSLKDGTIKTFKDMKEADTYFRGDNDER